MKDYNLNLILKILSSSSIQTFSDVVKYIDGYCDCVCFYENTQIMGAGQYKLFPGFNIFLKNKYGLNKYKDFRSVFSEMKTSEEEKFIQFIDSLKEYLALPEILRDPLYEEIYLLRNVFDEFKILIDIKNKLFADFCAFFDNEKKFDYNSDFKDFNSFVLNEMSLIDEKANWMDVLIERYGMLSSPQVFYRLYDDFCDLKKSKCVNCEFKTLKTAINIPEYTTQADRWINVKNFLPLDVCSFFEKVGFNNALIKKIILENKKLVIIFKKNEVTYKLQLSDICTMFSNVNISLENETYINCAEFQINNQNQKQFELMINGNRLGFIQIDFSHVSISKK